MSDVQTGQGEAFQRVDGLLSAAVGDELLMMSVERGKYYNLNPTGSRLWNLLASAATVDDLVAAVLTEYDVTPDTARKDILYFLDALRERVLVKTGDAAAA
jgi:hypothetical protein